MYDLYRPIADRIHTCSICFFVVCKYICFGNSTEWRRTNTKHSHIWLNLYILLYQNDIVELSFFLFPSLFVLFFPFISIPYGDLRAANLRRMMIGISTPYFRWTMIFWMSLMIWLTSIWMPIGPMHTIICHRRQPQRAPNPKMTMTCWAWNQSPTKCWVHHKISSPARHRIVDTRATMLICKLLWIWVLGHGTL